MKRAICAVLTAAVLAVLSPTAHAQVSQAPVTCTLSLTSTSNVCGPYTIQDNRGSIGLDITGITGSGATVQIQRAVASDWVAAAFWNVSTQTLVNTGNLTADCKQCVASAAASTQFRIVVTVAGTGSASIAYAATDSIHNVAVVNSLSVATPAPAPTGAHGAVEVEGVTNGTQVPTKTCDATTSTQCRAIDTQGGAYVTGENANNSTTVTANPQLIGCVNHATGSNITANSGSALTQCESDTVGDIFVRLGSPFPFTCTVTLSNTTAAQCQAAPGAGFRAYVTDIDETSGSTQTAGTLQLSAGTCTSSPTALGNPFAIPAGAANFTRGYKMPLVPAFAKAICVAGTGSTVSMTVTLNGFVAP